MYNHLQHQELLYQVGLPCSKYHHIAHGKSTSWGKNYVATCLTQSIYHPCGKHYYSTSGYSLYPYIHSEHLNLIISKLPPMPSNTVFAKKLIAMLRFFPKNSLSKEICISQY